MFPERRWRIDRLWRDVSGNRILHILVPAIVEETTSWRR